MPRQAQDNSHVPTGRPVPDRVLLPLAFDVAAMQADLAALERLDWTAHFVTANYSGQWDVLPLRAQAGATHPVMMIYSNPSASAWVDTPMLAHAPAFAAAIAAFACPVEAARLMRLTPGSAIHEHRDHDLDAAEGRARIHVPVTSNPGVRFLLNGTAVALHPGEAWYLRLADPHSVRNEGASDRVHLVIDVQVNAWLEEMLHGC
jgi:mannose-6-phosphate isomerase-like protein (cupin superfamily)